MNRNRVRLTESQLHRVINESVGKVLREGRKPNDVQHGKHSFKGLRYDRNGNPIYTYDGQPNASTQKLLKNQGWKMSPKHGLYGQISDPSKLYNESILHRAIKESVKKVLREGGNLTWQDDEGRMHTNSKDTWYGVEGSTFVWHGEWSDPEIYFEYDGEQYVLNGNEAEDWLWYNFKEYCEENGLNPDEHTDDEVWESFAEDNAEDVLLNMGPYNESYEAN